MTPLIGENQSIPSKPEPSKKPERRDDSFFRGRSQVSRYEIDRSLRKDAEVRNYLKRQLKLKNQKEIDEEIAKLEKRIPERFGGFIDKVEAKRLLFEEYWNARHDAQKMLEGGVTTPESKEVAKRKKEYEFLKKKFGIK